MTIEELIDKLSELPGDLEVFLYKGETTIEEIVEIKLASLKLVCDYGCCVKMENFHDENGVVVLLP